MLVSRPPQPRPPDADDLRPQGELVGQDCPSGGGDLVGTPPVVRRQRRDQTALDELAERAVQRSRTEADAHLLLDVTGDRVAVLGAVAERDQDQQSRVAGPSLDRHAVYRATIHTGGPEPSAEVQSQIAV